MVLSRAGRVARGVILTILILAVAVFGGSAVTVWGVAHSHTYAAADVTPHDVALVMGAAMWGNQPSPALQKRLDAATALYKSGKVKVIIVSGHVDQGYNEPKGMKDALVAAGVPAGKIVADNLGDDTFSSCWRAEHVFGMSSLIVVTQTYHLPRALAACRLVGIDAVGVGTGPGSYDATWVQVEAREIGANVKLLYDIATHRQLSPAKPSDAVGQALAKR